MELVTGLLTPEQMQVQLNTILSFLAGQETRNVKVIYGFSCQVDEQYEPIAVSMAGLPAFINQGQEDGIWQLGKDDFYITVPDLDAEFLLCHESDVHVTSDNTRVLEFFKSRWLIEGYVAYQKLDTEWQPLTLENEQLPV